MAPDCEKDCLDLSFPAVDRQASAGIETISAQLTAHGLPDDQIGDVRIALAEAINNVVEHAYVGIAPAQVEVHCRLCREKLDVVILDTGNPMPGLQVPRGEPASVDTSRQELPEGGFGWFLIRQLANDVRYEHRDGYNRLELRFVIADGSK